MKKERIPAQSGFSLVEVIVTLTIMSVLTLGLYSLIQLSLKITANNKYYVEALNIANQKMEQIRNLPYNSVGITTGIPNGVIPEYETINRDGHYTVHSYVSYYDDQYDGTEELGTDLLGADYKIATVKVTWQSQFGQKSVSVFSKIIPRTEETISNGGLLKIVVVDSNGNPVPNANIHIANATLVPAINFDAVANSSGKVSFPGAPAAYESYEITVTKSGYSTDKTYARVSPNLNPTKPHLSVTEGMKTEESFTIDLMGSLQVILASLTAAENQKLNTDTSGENQLNPRVTIDSSGNKYIVWQDYRSASAAKIYAQKYNSSNNKVWSSDVVISPANNQILPDVIVDDDGNLYVAWNDNSNGNQDAFLDKRLTSDGTSAWGTQKVDTLADAKDQINTRIAVINQPTTSDVFIVWQDDRNTDDDIFLQGFDAGRNKLLTNELRISDNPIGDNTDQNEPTITINNVKNLIITWTDERNGNQDIYAQSFNAGGARLWANDIKLNNDSGSAAQNSSNVAVDSTNNFYAIWTDERNGNQDVYMQKYNASGTKIWADDLRVNSDTGTSKQYAPSLAINSSDIIYAVWTDERNGNQDIYSQKISSDGTKQWTTDTRVNVNMGSTIQARPYIYIDPTDQRPYVTWHDNRNGDYDIYGVKINEPTGIQHIASAIPLIITGTKRIGENPVIYKVNQEMTTDATGILNTPIEWDSPGYTIALKTASTTYTLMMSDPTQPIAVLAGEAKSVILYLK